MKWRNFFAVKKNSCQHLVWQYSSESRVYDSIYLKPFNNCGLQYWLPIFRWMLFCVQLEWLLLVSVGSWTVMNQEKRLWEKFKPCLQFRSVIAKDRILAVMDWRLWACRASKAAVWLVFANFHSIVLPAICLPLKLVAMNVGGPAFWVWIFCQRLFVFL